MPKHSAVVGHDEASGTTKVFHRMHDGEWAYQTIQDISDVLDANKEAQNHVNTTSKSGEMRHVARVPNVIVVKWLNEYGVNFYDPDHWPAVRRMLNSSEWRWLRTDESVI